MNTRQVSISEIAAHGFSLSAKDYLPKGDEAMDGVIKFKQRKMNAVDALLALGRVFGLKSAVYVDAVDYVLLEPKGAAGDLLELEDMPTYQQVIVHAKQHMELYKEET